MTITNRDGTNELLAKDCQKLQKKNSELPKTAKNGQRLPEIAENCQIVIRKFRGAVSFHLNNTIGPLSKTCSKKKSFDNFGEF